MEMKKYRWLFGLLILVFSAGLMTACATTDKPAADTGIAPNITYQVADSAQINSPFMGS